MNFPRGPLVLQTGESAIQVAEHVSKIFCEDTYMKRFRGGDIMEDISAGSCFACCHVALQTFVPLRKLIKNPWQSKTDSQVSLTADVAGAQLLNLILSELQCPHVHDSIASVHPWLWASKL